MLASALFLLLLIYSEIHAQYYPRRTILQEEYCFYEPSRAQLTCRCDNNIHNSFLLLRLAYNVVDIGQKVDVVEITSCADLLLSLDLKNVKPPQILISSSGGVTIDLLEMDARSTLDGEGSSVTQIRAVNMEVLYLREIKPVQAVQVNATNVKKVLVTGSTFLSPNINLEVLNSTSFEIRNSYFRALTSKSIQATSVDDVTVVNNQFNINPIKVVSVRDVKKLHLSCNRIIGEPVDVECVQGAHPTSTVLSFLSQFYNREFTEKVTRNLETSTTVSINSTDVQQASLLQIEVSNQAFVGIMVGMSLIIAVFLTYLLIIGYRCRRRGNMKRTSDGNSDIGESTELETLVSKRTKLSSNSYIGNQMTSYFVPSEPRSSCPSAPRSSDRASGSLNSGYKHKHVNGDQRRDRERTPTSTHHKRQAPAYENRISSTPLWIQEIHNNRIFAKQCSNNYMEELMMADPRQVAEGPGPIRQSPEVKRRSNPGRVPVRSISEVMEYENLEEIERILKAEEAK